MIRMAVESDAASIAGIRKEITMSDKTTKFFISSPSEVSVDLHKEKESIRKCNGLYLVYEQEGRVIGYILLRRYEPERLHHVGSIEMGIREAFPGQGIGKTMIQHVLEWAADQQRLEKICLGVVSVNSRASHVYKQMGFEEEGRLKNQIRFEDGTYADDVLMAWYVKK
ncbi:GNAT family N-acetyltransferase [Halobacillus litoralis]|uniref:GNAT family N-acetyltransferase n=1 Tax=Halobacillus litoralis TaxID=45668 RepID=UPI001CD7F503|nr:GNAT family N-acetyltransferase [Halobacillus litoralis]MCA0969300.1 GNAT family N-acetyltransferase [Halobacillus litoralis]